MAEKIEHPLKRSKDRNLEQDTMLPETRDLLPDNHNELFGVKTSAFIIANDDI